MKKRHSVHTLLLAGVMSVGLSQELAIASQPATETATVQRAQGPMPPPQSQGNTSQTQSDSTSTSSELGGTGNSLSSTNTSGLFGGDACRPEKIEVTPCQ